MTTSQLITVGRAYGTPEAGMAMALLEGHGIAVFVHPWHTLALSWHWTHALGGIELRVPVSQAEEAAALLAGFQITPRPGNRLLRLFFGLIVLFLANLPPPPSGFFAAPLRPALARAAAPSRGAS